jgi:hypothetical protein
MCLDNYSIVNNDSSEQVSEPQTNRTWNVPKNIKKRNFIDFFGNFCGHKVYLYDDFWKVFEKKIYG